MKFLTRDLKTELVFTTPTEAFWTYMNGGHDHGALHRDAGIS